MAIGKKGDGALYRLSIEVGLNFDEDPKSRRQRIELTGRRQVFEITVDCAPASVLLDPDLWALMDAEFLKISAYPSDSTFSMGAEIGNSGR